jgi:hypothetical protein
VGEERASESSEVESPAESRNTEEGAGEAREASSEALAEAWGLRDLLETVLDVREDFEGFAESEMEAAAKCSEVFFLEAARGMCAIKQAMRLALLF